MTDYLSFDVGIKNLAYCHLSSNKLIKGWGIINLGIGLEYVLTFLEQKLTTQKKRR